MTKNLEGQRARRKRYLDRGDCGCCGKNKPRKGLKTCDSCLKQQKQTTKERLARGHRKWRDAALSAYGSVCTCCNETERLFLEIHHMNGGGSQLKSAGKSIGRYLRDAGYPPGFEILCANCHRGKHLNNGVCPHSLTS